MKRSRGLFLILIVACGAWACAESDDDEDADADDDASDDDASPADDDDDNDDQPINPYLNPDQPGPYLVGNTSVFLEDTERPLSCGEGNRILLTEIWYPAADGSDTVPENTIKDFFLGRWEEAMDALEEAGFEPGEQVGGENLPTGSYRDAPLHPDVFDMPALLFSHGFTGHRFQNYTMATYLASHGYVVVGADHICNTIVTLTPDEAVVMSLLDVPLTLSERKGDMMFLIDQLKTGLPEEIAARIDATHVGLWGHSFGGITVSETIKIEPRASALLQLASFGFPLPPIPDTVTARSMYFWGKQDKWMFLFRGWHDQFVAEMPKPTYELEFFNTGHFAFSDLCLFVPPLAANGNGCVREKKIGSDEFFDNPPHDKLHRVLNAYATAFFGSVFFGYDELATYLEDNQWPGMMQYFVTAE